MTRQKDTKHFKKQILPRSVGELLCDPDGELLGIKFLYTIHDKRIAVLLLWDSPPEYDQRDSSVPARYLERYDEARWWSDGAEDPENSLKRQDALFEEMEKLVCKVCYDMLMELAGPSSTSTSTQTNVICEGKEVGQVENLNLSRSPQTLYEYMYPESFVLQLVSEQGQMRCIHRDDIPPTSRWPERLDVAEAEAKAQVKVPMYTPSEICIVKRFMFHSWVLQVLTPDASLLCCKLSAGHLDSFPREYQALRKMYDAGCTTESLRVPQLRGLVRNESGHGKGGVVGILTDYVDTELYELTFHLAPPAPIPMSLEEYGNVNIVNKEDDNSDSNSATPQPHIPDIDPSRRERWSSQIQSIVHKLHELDIVWGDAKTANILLDRNDDLWVIDFGGGGTPGWIDRKLMDTKEGDLQALKRILEEIGGKRRVWRSDQRPPTNPQAT